LLHLSSPLFPLRSLRGNRLLAACGPTFFGNDRHAIFSAKPGIVPLRKDAQERWRPDSSFPMPSEVEKRTGASAVQVEGAIGPSDGNHSRLA